MYVFIHMEAVLSILWCGIRSTIRKEYKNGYIVLDMRNGIERSIDLIVKHYKITDSIHVNDVLERICYFLQKRGFVVAVIRDEITISWPFYFLGSS